MEAPVTQPRDRHLSQLGEKARARLAGAGDGWFFARIADQVQTQRTARSLSQRELAELVGTTQSAIARLERGGRPPKLDTLMRIADALDAELLLEMRLRPRETE